jgi:phosphoribosyl-AMP cyclohydrolase
MLTEGERRVPTLMLRHNEVNRVVDEMIPSFAESFEEDQFLWAVYMNNATLVREIFQKLQVMFSRYKGQVHQLSW